jgi:hypothetical protein
MKDDAPFVELEIKITRVGKREMRSWADLADAGDVSVWMATSRYGPKKRQYMIWASLMVRGGRFEIHLHDPVMLRIVTKEIEEAMTIVCAKLAAKGVREALKGRRGKVGGVSASGDLVANGRFQQNQKQAILTIEPVAGVKDRKRVLRGVVETTALWVKDVFGRLRLKAQDSGFPAAAEIPSARRLDGFDARN